MVKEPKTLQEAILYFADPDNAVAYMVARRWPNGVSCPTCGRTDVAYISARRLWQCKTRHPKCQFSVKVGTVMEDSAIGLDKWLVAMWMIANCKNGVSSWEIHRSLGITQKAAWFMLHRLRLALGEVSDEKMGGPEGGGTFEADESYIGSQPKNRHGYNPKKQAKFLKNEDDTWSPNPNYVPHTGKATKKVPVMGILDREARQVRAKVIPNVDRRVLQEAILENVSKGSKIYTDSLGAYSNLNKLDFVHEAVNHVTEYVRGEVHTNGLENFWAMLKRGLKGTYIAVEPFHLDRYVGEQVFRYNNRATKERPLTDADRFRMAVAQIVGKRLTYTELTGKDQARPF